MSLLSGAYMATHYELWCNSTLDKMATKGGLSHAPGGFFTLIASNSKYYLCKVENTLKKLPFSNAKFCHTHKNPHELEEKKKAFNEILSLRRSGILPCHSFLVHH